MFNYDEQYRNILTELLTNGITKEDNSRSTSTVYSLGNQIKVNIENSFPLLTLRKVNLKPIVAELIWFMQGKTHISELESKIWNQDAYNHYVRKIGKRDALSFEEFVLFAKKGDEYAYIQRNDGEVDEFSIGDCGPIYGMQWRDFNGVDQLVNTIESLKYDFTSRQKLISAWNPEDLPYMTLPPCHDSFLFSGRLEADGTKRLSILYRMRSNDFYLGQPFNTASYALLLEIVCDLLEATPEYVVGQLGDTHLYSNQWESAKTLSVRSSTNSPKLVKSDEYYDLVKEYHDNELILEDFIDELKVNMFSLEGYEPNPPLSVKMLAKDK